MKVKKKLLWTTIVSIGFLLTLGFFTDIAFAEEKPNESIYQRFAYILHISDGWLWQDLLRTIGGGTVFLLAWLNGFLEGIIDKVITLNNFYSSGPMGEFMKVARPVVWGVFFIALFVLGFQFMMNKVEKRNEIILNVVLALCFIVVIPDLMVSMGKVTEVGINQINPEKTKLSSQLIKSNVADLRYYAEKDFKVSNKKNGDEYLPPQPMSKEDSRIGTTDFTYGNRLSEKSLPYISFAQKLDISEDGEAEKWGKKLDDNHKFSYEVLSNKLDPTGNGDEFEVIELRENQIPLSKLGQESYYRYHVNWGVLIFSLLVTSFAMIITIIKIGRAAFDLAFHQIFGMFVAATDLTGGQRTKKILVEMANTFGIIFIMTLLLKIFVLYSSWANGLKGSIGGIGVLLLLIAGAWALMDAPDIVARMMGIDAGLKSGYGALMGAYAGAKMAGGVGKAIGKGVKGAGKMATGGANYGRRMIEGMRTPTLSEMAKKQGNDMKKNQNGKLMSGINMKNDGPNQQGSVGKQEKPITNGGSPQGEGSLGIAKTGGAFPTTADGYNQLGSGLVVPESLGKEISTSIAPASMDSGSMQGITKGSVQGGNAIKPKLKSINPSSNLQQVQSKKDSNSSKNVVDFKKENGQGVKNTGGHTHGGTYVNGQSSGTTVAETNQSFSGGSSGSFGNTKTGGAFPTTADGYKQLSSGLMVPESVAKEVPSSPTTSGSGGLVQGKNVISTPTERASVANEVLSNQGGSFATTTMPNHWGERTAQDGTALKHGHKVVTHSNTMVGGSRIVREFKESATRAGNSGFSGGQMIRTVGLGSARLAKSTTKMAGKATIQASRAILHPKATMRTTTQKISTMGAKIGTTTGKKIANASTKTRETISQGVKKSTTAIQRVSTELKRPPGQSWNTINRKDGENK